MEFKERERIRNTSIKKINEILETNLNIEILRDAKNFKTFGNGKFAIKYVDSEN